MKSFLKKILPESVKLFYHKMMADFSNLIYGYPSRKMIIIGVTGTNGKTTTCHFIYNILKNAGCRVGMMTTTTLAINQEKWVNKTRLTTFAAAKLNKFLKKMVEQGCEYAILETSSHAAIQYRTRGIAYDLCVITNITREHLDYHKTFEEYKKAKREILELPSKSFRKPHVPKQIVLNRDEANYEYLSDIKADRKFRYGILRGDIIGERINYKTTSSDFLVKTPFGNKRITINLPGRFNVYNALAAITATVALAIDLETIRLGLLRTLGVPGRMEKISPQKKLKKKMDFNVIVDFAHTPDAFYQIFETIRNVEKNRLICVFGAAGERDKTKRPLLGNLASSHSQVIIITSEDPRSEEPQTIIKEIKKGVLQGEKGKNFSENENLFLIEDRESAIKKALSLAQAGDLVMILGKGAEQTQDLKSGKIKWDDRKITRKLLNHLLSKK
ncbi:UDP-N-acetylmuramoyl-L-alanyl-D-glutamate--2,6-diaminopimelate ligase [Patescibacteria group bacterium]|nr:UDP-N-acetylmuramoyl-L-alanyl-D-glutamate--2,6-diaminopimelate ligase [Patescibacteria group bacterium]